MYDQLRAFAQAFCATHPLVDVDGDYYEAPGITVFTQATHKLAGKGRGRIEINTLAPEAPTSFEWQYEITINQPLEDIFIHLLLRRDGELVETYGKTVLEVDDDRAQEILNILTELTSETA